MKIHTTGKKLGQLDGETPMFDRTRVLVVGLPGATAPLTRQLWMNGCAVLVAHSYENAKMLCENTRFDVLICDLDLLNDDDRPLATTLKATGQIKIAIGLVSQQNTVTAEEFSCFHAMLVKPVEPQQVMESVESVMGQIARRSNSQ